MKFTKMQGLGNDYIYINGFVEQIDCPSEVAIKMSDRHFGVGADGLICINSSEVADFEMAMYNADGTRGEMCGNGIRCVGKYLYDRGLTKDEYLSIETLAGIKYLELHIENGEVESVRVDMGHPILRPEAIPVEADGIECVAQSILVGDKEYEMTCVSMGNPHAVIYIEEMEHLEIEKVGPEFEHHSRFPNRVNTEFARVIDEDTVEMRVWERGSGETLACGTGACAVVVASVLNGYTKDKVTVKLLGGDLEIEWDQVSNTVYMTGPAKIVFDGEMDLY